MTETVLKEIIHRAVRDGAYRAQLQGDPAAALAGFSLTAEERAAITSGDPARLSALGVEQRMSKAFAAGVLGDASKVIVVDPGTTGAGVIDEAQFDATGLRAVEREGDASAAVIDAPATERPAMWRIEQDLDAGDSLKAPEGSDLQITGDVEITEY
jgi:hypothetical protein